VEERRAGGRAARVATPRRQHAGWTPPDDRADPVAAIEASNTGRVPELVPIRHARMARSASTFYRGAASIMAADLATMPSTPLRVQLCGDCHLSNFGVYATPERTLTFDVNDFDETAPGPFEWDVKRLAASAALAARGNGFPRNQRSAARSAARGYREWMEILAGRGPLDVRYERVVADDLIAEASEAVGSRAGRRVEGQIRRARSRTSAGALPKLTKMVDGERRIISDPPFVTAPRDDVRAFVDASLLRYRRSLSRDVRSLYDRFDVIDVARKVVGVGSVGLQAFILLLMADGQPLFLQLKEAGRSVIEPYAGRAPVRHPGERVVVGQRTMQAASDLFLGWLTTPAGEPFYVRQLRDMKGSQPVEELDAAGLEAYAYLCGSTLRSGARALG
jgi:uncharacterized protein (DUF2252 family)